MPWVKAFSETTFFPSAVRGPPPRVFPDPSDTGSSPPATVMSDPARLPFGPLPFGCSSDANGSTSVVIAVLLRCATHQNYRALSSLSPLRCAWHTGSESMVRPEGA